MLVQNSLRKFTKVAIFSNVVVVTLKPSKLIVIHGERVENIVDVEDIRQTILSTNKTKLN